MKLSLAIQTPEVASTVPVCLLNGTFEARLVRAAELGADGIELIPLDPAKLDPAAIRAQLASNRLEAAAVGSVALGLVGGLTLLHADRETSALARSRLRDLIVFASKVGAPVLTLGNFRGRFSSVGVNGRETLIQIVREAAAYAADQGVRLAMEPINRYQIDGITNAAEGLAFLDDVGHPALGLMLDTCHVNMEESSWTEPFGRVMAAGRLLFVHIADNNRLAPGQGLIDFSAIVKELIKAGYSGYLSAEILAKPDPDTAAVQSMSYMRRLM
jgi:sugar phosphate isomerase/epimerase